jgi:type IV fimbrial biogenesis protein FimT
MRGFTLIELAVVILIIGILVTLGIPTFSTWMANSRVRMVAESLENDLRQAQAEAVRRNRQVALVLTSSTPSAAAVAAVTPAKNWSVRALPLLNSDEGSSAMAGTTTFILGNAETASSDVTVAGDNAVVCFNSVGRLVTSATTIADAGDASCAAPTTNVPLYYKVQNASGDRPLWVQVYLGGRVRMCDPNKTLPSQPDGCCTSQCCGFGGTHCIN